MSLPHPLYGEHAFCDPIRGVHRWSVTGTTAWIEAVENGVEDGMTPEEIVAGHLLLPPSSLPHVTEIHRLHRAYLVRIGRLPVD